MDGDCPGARVIEAGTGSGALTMAFAYMVGETGKVYTYETREEMFNLARKNLAAVGLDSRVVFHHQHISEGFEETQADALFLDLPDPWNYLPQVKQALKPGGYFRQFTAYDQSGAGIACRTAPSGLCVYQRQ